MKDKCILCLKNPGDTKEHIPPKNLRTSKVNNKFLTVPTCKNCNSSYSSDEESFRNDLAMVADPTTAGEMYQSFLRSMGYSPKILKGIKGRLKPLGVETTISIPTERTNRVLIKIAKGLVYCHANKTLIPLDCQVSVHFNPQETALDIQRKAQVVNDLAGESLKYWGAIAEDNPRVSIWWLLLYGSVLAIVTFSDPES